MIEGFVDGFSGKSAPFFWLLAFVLVSGLVSNAIFLIRIGIEFLRWLRRPYRGERTIASGPNSTAALK